MHFSSESSSFQMTLCQADKKVNNLINFYFLKMFHRWKYTSKNLEIDILNNNLYPQEYLNKDTYWKWLLNFNSLFIPKYLQSNSCPVTLWNDRWVPLSFTTKLIIVSFWIIVYSVKNYLLIYYVHIASKGFYKNT